MAESRTSKGELTREALMNAGFTVFADKGFLRAQIGDIARAAGKSSGVFHIYFKNKEALLDAWLDRADQMVLWYQADTDLLFEKGRQFVVENYWAFYQRYGPILEAQEAAALISPYFQERLETLRRKGDESIARMIRHAQGEGRHLGIDPELTAISIASIITRTTAYWFRNRLALEQRGIDHHTVIAHIVALYAQMLESSVDSAVDEFPISANLVG